MRANKKFVQDCFDRFNALIFNDELTPLPIVISSSANTLGAITYKRHREFFKGERYSDFKLRISCRFDFPLHVIEDIILHELIHYHILSNQLKDTSPHGVMFTAMMNDINRRFGRNITKSHRISETESSSDLRRRLSPVCVAMTNCGEVLVMTPPLSKVQEFWNLYPSKSIVRHQWVITDDPFFNRFPKSRSMKFYRLSADELSSHLSDARLLVKNPRGIMLSPQTLSVGDFVNLC